MKAELKENEVVLTAETDFEQKVLTTILHRSVEDIIDQSSINWTESTNKGKAIILKLWVPKSQW